MKVSMKSPFELSGRWSFRLRSLASLFWSTYYVSIRRLLRGPLLPGWSWNLETSTHFLKHQSAIGFEMRNPKDMREYEDALLFASPAVEQVEIEAVEGPVRGHWFSPKSGAKDLNVLYLHGGGYAYYSRSHQNLIALVTLATQSRTFALDYRLIPEHPYPAQLEDALAAYRWLLEDGVRPEELAVIGDSAGGNLTLALLLALRQVAMPLPTAAVLLGPWTDVANSGESMTTNERYDWVGKRMPERWAEWFCAGRSPADPLISPIQADLRGLPPISVQAGGAEILLDMIRDFARRAKAQGAEVELEVWPNMPHDFQAYGEVTPESGQALARIGEVARQYMMADQPVSALQR